MGGAMDLVANVKRVIVMMEHVSKNGAPKILNHCTFPLTGSEVVSRIITDLGVFDIDNHNIYLVKKPEDVSIDEIISKTEALFEYRPLTI
jgi:3-oxoacid CoA-transferase subunit B